MIRIKTANSKQKSVKRKEKKAQGLKPFPIVGIGGSAGGLEAFTNLLQHLPSNWDRHTFIYSNLHLPMKVFLPGYL